jgi:hypothetical protein
MKMGIKSLIVLSILAGLLVSCSSTKIYKRPEGSVFELNTDADELAPMQKSIHNETCSPCIKEFRTPMQQNNDGVQTSKQFLQEMLESNYNINPEAVCFVDFNHGFFAVSHPPDEESAAKLGLALAGKVGGTDLYEFKNDKGKISFNNLGKKINSLFWDSQPAAVSDDNCNILLIWASDRNDLGGYASPFNTIVDIVDFDTSSYKGNTDLFYCFQKDGKWSDVKNLKDINTKFYEQTPFIYCMCNNPTLLFASNRNGSFDIFAAKLTVDFDSETVAVDEPARALPQGGINSESKEFFPFVANPISEEGNKNRLYFSSNRNVIEKKLKGDTVLKNFGGFDIYSFNLPDYLDCKTPGIHYKLVIIDSLNPQQKVKGPLFWNLNSNNIEQADTSGEFILKPNVKYIISGGSLYDKIECIPGADKSIAYYSIRKIKKTEPEIIEKDTIIKYTVAEDKVVSQFVDTLHRTVTVHKDELVNLTINSNSKIEDMKVSGDSVTITFMELIGKAKAKRIEIEKSKKITITTVIPQWDTVYTKITKNNLALSEKTKRYGHILFTDVKDDIYVNDTIYVWPKYFIYPPCEWKYEKDEIEYSKNVPYFQTCFWEVNTSGNFKRDMKLIRSKKYADASFIELHSKNQYFGYRRSDLSPEQKKFRKLKNQNRVRQYSDYAKKVDVNLNNMADEISNNIIPLFREYDEHSGGLQNKLIITINAYSDVRPVIRGRYLGDETVSYMSAVYDSVSNSIVDINHIKIEPLASLEDPLNDYLSKLRAYFGYREIIKRLKQKDNFKYYFDKGLVLLPDEISTEKEFKDALSVSKIIILVRGKQVDPSVKAVKMGYFGKSGDYKVFDPVRRIDVIVKRVEWDGVRFIRPECCKSGQ